MNIRSLLTIMVFWLAATSVQAIPAKPGTKKTIRQADGTVVELTLRGDEHFSFYTDATGAAFKLLPGNKLQPITAEQVSETWSKRRQARMNAATARTRGAGDPDNVTTGKHRGLIILMQFKDQKFVTPEPQKVFDRFFNETGYNENGMSGSVKDYFLAQSYNKLEIDFDVVGPYTAKDSMAYYGSHIMIDDYDNADAHAEELIAEAAQQASADVDYSKYDWNEDSVVDQVFVIYAGYSEAQGAAPETIWPHEWSLKYAGMDIKYNGVTLATYGCAAELMGNGKDNTGKLDGIGTACHEFSHCLGLMDMYDTESQTNYGMSYWDVMDSGSYLDNSCTPAGYTSYERWSCGWLEPTELKGDMTQIAGMKPLAESPECYVMYNDAYKNEYYLLENRQKVGFDAALPGHGLLVLHVDYDRITWLNNKVNTDRAHQRVTIIPADNEAVATAKSLAGDPFPGTSANTALAVYSTPAPTLYHANTDGSYYMNKAIDSITESDDSLISFVALRPEFTAPESVEAKEVEGQPSSFTITWPAVNNAVSYQVELDEPFTVSPADAVVGEYDFAKTQTETVGTTDISQNLKDYGLDDWIGSNLFTTPNKLRIGTPSETGNIYTATLASPSSKKLTVVFGAGLVDNKPVGGTILLYHYDNGNSIYGDGYYIDVNKDGYYLFNFYEVNYDRFYVFINPDAQMYLNYFAAYDDIWTKEELGLDEGSSAGKHYHNATIYDTDTNSITLSDLNTDRKYIYRVRAKSVDGFYSRWTTEQPFQFSPSGISSVQLAPQHAGKIFDLQGRPRGTDPSALPKGIYIIDGKKVVK